MALHIVIGIICAVVCGIIASHKGRSVAAWVLMGFLFGLIPLIIVACLSNKKLEQAQREQFVMEQHRLREQLRQERIKTESFRRYSLGRLDSHDKALGLDTRTATALPGGSAPEALPGATGDPIEDALQQMGEAPVAATPPPKDEPMWYYENGGQALGPVPERQLRAMLRLRRLGNSTLVWTEGMANWAKAASLPAFQDEVQA